MPALQCPHCGVLANFSAVWTQDFAGSTVSRADWAAAYRCTNEACMMVVGGICGQGDPGHVLDYWPKTVGGKQFPDVPDAVAAAADEAHQCHSIGAFRAAMALARAVVEATAKEKGVTSGSLEKKIDQLCSDGYIRKDTRDAAHAVRLVGNDAAHGDLAIMVVHEADALDVLELMDDILDEVFQSPQKVARVAAGRAARRVAAGGKP
jgi:uncharacterized protein DUF4145